MSVRNLNVSVPSSESLSPLWVGSGIIPSLTRLLKTERFSQVLVVGDQGASGVVESVVRPLEIDSKRILLIRGGEECKSLDYLEKLWDFFATSKLDRSGLVIGVGGGSLSDLVGFAAATYMRGVAFAAVPTTLLAQVDAGIGGKSGINFNGVKNVVGAIAQPIGIIIDLDTLKSLPAREIRSGFAEIVKHGLISDRSYFEMVTSRHCSQWEQHDLLEIVFRSCQIKAEIVGQDATEKGIRKALNFGHSLGHAIEAYSLDASIPLTHGECVAIGMNAACFISVKVGLLSLESQRICAEGISRAGLPLSVPTVIATDKLLDLLTLDKKNVAGVTRWSLLSEIGSVVVNQHVPTEIVQEAISYIQP